MTEKSVGQLVICLSPDGPLATGSQSGQYIVDQTPSCIDSIDTIAAVYDKSPYTVH